MKKEIETTSFFFSGAAGALMIMGSFFMIFGDLITETENTVEIKEVPCVEENHNKILHQTCFEEIQQSSHIFMMGLSYLIIGTICLGYSFVLMNID